jgi:hypothetical protein
MISGDSTESKFEYWWIGIVVGMTFLLDIVWYSLELSGRIGLVGGVYSTVVPSAYLSATGFGLWIVLVTVWSFLLAAAIRLTTHQQSRRITTLALVIGVGTFVYYLVTHPLLLPFLAAHVKGVPGVLDAWYGRRISISQIVWICAIHGLWLTALLSVALRRRVSEA